MTAVTLDAPAAEVPGHEEQRRGRGLPWIVVPALLVAGASVLMASMRIVDIDSFWHVLVGRDILAGTSVAGAARGWSFAPVADTWVSSQWLAETLFAWLDRTFGLDALLVYRWASTLLALLSLAMVTLYRRPVRAAVVPFGAATVGLLMASQERSQQLTFVLAPVVGWWLERTLRQGRLPRWWVVLPLTVVWANYHGGWVILPLALALAALARVLDHGWRDPVARGALGRAAACVAASMVSPLGWHNAVTSWTFSSSAAALSEWQRVRVFDEYAAPFVILLVLWVVAFARGLVRPTWGEVVVLVALTALATSAWRGLPVTELLIAPLTVGIVARAVGWPDPTPVGTRQPGRRVAAAIVALGVLVGGVLVVRTVPAPSDTWPYRLFRTVADAPGPVKVLNGYNISGPLLYFGGGPGHVLVAVDGRSERYGSDYISRYIAMTAATPGWRVLFDELDPQVALLPSTDPLTGVLIGEEHWVLVDGQDGWTLLAPPHTPGFTP